MDRHQGEHALLVAQTVLLGVERDLLEEPGEAALALLLLVLARDADELLEVLDVPCASIVRSASSASM